jgi:hypothetical protein
MEQNDAMFFLVIKSDEREENDIIVERHTYLYQQSKSYINN